jgi:hypothetical protein
MDGTHKMLNVLLYYLEIDAVLRLLRLCGGETAEKETL